MLNAPHSIEAISKRQSKFTRVKRSSSTAINKIICFNFQAILVAIQTFLPKWRPHRCPIFLIESVKSITQAKKFRNINFFMGEVFLTGIAGHDPLLLGENNLRLPRHPSDR
jgi:hypothetical protein